MATTMYFELGMMFAMPSFFVGLAFVLEIDAHLWPRGAAYLVFFIAALGSAYWFHRWATDTHEVLCTTRLKINHLLDKTP
jgi:hypothetical protein